MIELTMPVKRGFIETLLTACRATGNFAEFEREMVLRDYSRPSVLWIWDNMDVEGEPCGL